MRLNEVQKVLCKFRGIPEGDGIKILEADKMSKIKKFLLSANKKDTYIPRSKCGAIDWGVVKLIAQISNHFKIDENLPIDYRGFVCVRHNTLGLQRIVGIPSVEIPQARSLLRLRRKSIANAHRFYAFLTITFDDDGLEMLDKKYASQWIRDRIRVAKKQKWFKAEYLWRFELGGESARPHFHMIIDRFVPCENLYKMFAKCGYIQIENIEEPEKASQYISKYICKGTDNILLPLTAKATYRTWATSRGWDNGLKLWKRIPIIATEKIEENNQPLFKLENLRTLVPLWQELDLGGVFRDINLFGKCQFIKKIFENTPFDEFDKLEFLYWKLFHPHFIPKKLTKLFHKELCLSRVRWHEARKHTQVLPPLKRISQKEALTGFTILNVDDDQL